MRPNYGSIPLINVYYFRFLNHFECYLLYLSILCDTARDESFAEDEAFLSEDKMEGSVSLNNC